MNTPAQLEDRKLIDAATEVSVRIIQKNVSDKGLAASIDAYPQVWARDSIITFLGGAISKDKQLLNAFRASLEILGNHQDRFGQVPYLVHIKDGKTEFRSADANPWLVIGAVYYARLSSDRAWFKAHASTVIKALDWCESRDYKKLGLMESGECDDWADLLSNRGYVLFPNVLYYAALRLAAEELAADFPQEAARFAERASYVKDAIQNVFWVKPPGSFEDTTHEQTRTHISVSLRKRSYFLPWVNCFDYGERFDTTANVLAILTGVATQEQSESILDYIHQTGLDRPFPVRVLYPSIQPNEKDWRDYYKIYGCNLPDHYHNGGIWPWVGGAYVAALAKCGRSQAAQENLTLLAASLRAGKNEWECNEWLHGLSGVPMGATNQAWSAGMFLYAIHAVETGEAAGF